MAKFVRRITVVDLNGVVAPEQIYKSKKKKRKISRWMKPFERHDRRMADAMKAFGGELSRRHRRSNRKRRNGWLRDGGTNVLKAGRKGFKKLRKK